MMAAKYWLKLYYDMLDDPKVGRLRHALRWRFIECLLVAGECDEDGYLPDPAAYAWRVRDNVEAVETDFVQLAEGGLLSQHNGRWLVTKFAERQAPISSTERWRQWRDRQRKQEYEEEQTNFQRSQTEVQTKRLTDTDTDKIRVDVDTDKTQLPPHLHIEPLPSAWGEWQQYHTDRGKPITTGTALRQFKQFEKMGPERAAAAIDYSISMNYTGLVEPKDIANGQVSADDRKRRIEELLHNEGLA